MSSKKLTVPLMIVAFVAMGGMLWWLATSAPEEPDVAAAAETDTARAGGRGAGGATSVAVSDFSGSREQYQGQRIRLTNVNVVTRVNDRLWYLAPEDRPILIVVDSAMAGGVSTGQEGIVVGRYLEMTDSVMGAWEEAGIIENENQRFTVSLADAYLEAAQLNLRAAGGDGD